MRRRLQKGLTMIELLIVMGIIAIVAAMATANYFIGLTRAKQKRTVADIRAIALAWEARAVDVHTYAPAGYTFPTQITYQEIYGALVPTYTRVMPQYDGWKRPLQFAFEPSPSGGPGNYGIRSAGRDGEFQGSVEQGVTNDPDCDIVFADGNFIAYPDTVQSN